MSITLAHLIIIWTLSILLIAWMLVFAILALRSKTTTQDETLVESRERVSSTPNTRTPPITAPALLVHRIEPVSSNTVHYDEVPTSVVKEEVPATPIM